MSVWIVRGRYTSDGQRWQLNGERAFLAEASTAIGHLFPGTAFRVQITGSLAIGMNGTW
jgi:hypothetical protein